MRGDQKNQHDNSRINEKIRDIMETFVMLRQHGLPEGEAFALAGITKSVYTRWAILKEDVGGYL